MTEDNRRPAVLGEKAKLEMYHGGKRILKALEVQAQCSPTGSSGQWVCIAHKKAQPLENNFSKESHCADCAAPVLAWYCYEHGQLEVP